MGRSPANRSIYNRINFTYQKKLAGNQDRSMGVQSLNTQKVSALLALNLMLSITSISMVLSETEETTINDEDVPSVVKPKPFEPPNEEEPARTVGGASRGNCSTGDIAKITFQTTESTLTASLPEGMAEQVFFSLRDPQNNTVFQGFIPVIDNQAVISDLEVAEEEHTWSMAIICDRALRPDSPVFRGTF